MTLMTSKQVWWGVVSQGGAYLQQPPHPHPAPIKGTTLGVKSQVGHFLALTHPVVHVEMPAAAWTHYATARRLATSHHPTSLPWGVIWPPLQN